MGWRIFILSFDQLIEQINENNKEQRDRGTAFEYLVQAYLKHEPLYKNLYSDVWMLSEVPESESVPKKDTGVDLVAKKFTGELVAIQAKFYDHRIQKSDIDSYLGELGKGYYAEGLIVSTTDDWGENAEQAIIGLTKPLSRIGLSDLRHSQIDWDSFSFDRKEEIKVKAVKQPRGYQKEVISNALEHFKENDRGQLIMAPGTGKTFTSLKVAESMAKESGQGTFKVLYLVPSIQLLTQTLRAWNNDTEMTISSMAVTSDRNASRGRVKQDESNLFVKATDIGFPATTSTEQVLKNWKELEQSEPTDLFVVFSTYQSIEVLGKAQENGFPEFDLIVADEAHRTTGATALNEEDSVFVKVHDNANIKGKNRLYQTATPKIYGADAKTKGKELSVEIASMDDESKYGTVFYRLGFGDAISRDFLTDYKLMVLAVDEATIHRDMQRSLSDPENGLNVDDIGRIIGVWNGMLKRETDSNNVLGAPMKRAIAFSRTINDSKRLSSEFESVVNDYLSDNDDNHFTARVCHADGTMNALQKNEALDWLADESLPENEARILSNVRFLTEGIDVPSLDAIIFLSPRKSQVDIVQAVGRIIRKSPDKEYGYIILPIVIPTGVSPESILDNNKQYDVVWQVLNALRSVDERFEATINKLQLNKKKPENISVIGVGGAPDDEDGNWKNGGEGTESTSGQMSFDFEWAEIEGAIYGKIVQKVGDRRYLEDWSQDVAKIAQRHIDYTNELIKSNSDMAHEFSQFLKSLQHNINSSITQEQAVEMLAQHLITKPVFDALFNEYSVVRNNPVNDAMEKIVKKFSAFGFPKEQKELEAFYESVKLRASGIDNAEAKQQIIVTLYDKFFRTGFKETTERLGIVFTPVEVVDFIIHSVDDVLRKYFNKTIASKGVHILDPFTGTGTFITRMLQYLKGMMDRGEIQLEDILEKYMSELHANEIILLSYYIAAINIEAVFDEINGEELDYEPFEGIVLTDTFQSTETEDTLDDDFFGGNDERLKRQQEVPITVIMGNPPYSGRQGSENDDNENIKYPLLDSRLEETYIKKSTAIASHAVYDTYIKAIRWASDRIESNGIIAFITGNSYIDGLSTDGLRKSLYSEFNHLYVINLKGALRGKTKYDLVDEGGNIFNILTGVAIMILVKDGSSDHHIHYIETESGLSRKEKLNKLSENKSVKHLNFKEIIPDENNDWINQTNKEIFSHPLLLNETENSKGIFQARQLGINSKRDKWVYNFSSSSLKHNVEKTIKIFNQDIEISKESGQDFYTLDESKISWSDELKRKHRNRQKIVANPDNITTALYRPFTKKYLYYDKSLIARPGNWGDFDFSNNVLMMLPGKSNRRAFSTLMTNMIPDLNNMDAGAQSYFLKIGSEGFLEEEFNLNQNLIQTYHLQELDMYYYIYSLLHSTDYLQKFSSNFKKEPPRIPLLKNKEKFVEIGRKLADLHLNYEHQPNWEGVTVSGEDSGNFKVKKMKHPKKGQLDTIVFNESITISNIPEQAYEYIVNGRPAIEWIIDQYQIKTDKKSGITDDPNEFAPENPRYILDLLLSVITVSLRTVELVAQLPEMEVVE